MHETGCETRALQVWEEEYHTFRQRDLLFANNPNHVAAEMDVPSAVTVAPDGSIYVGDGEFPARVRKIGTDGIIVTIMGAGTNFNLCGGDSILARQACIGDPIQDLVWGPDDRLYVLEEDQLRRINTDGLARVVAGDPFRNCSTEAGDGGPATSGGICSTSVAVSPTGRIYLADNQERVRVVEPSGLIGTFGTGPCADGGGILLLMQFSSARPGFPGFFGACEQQDAFLEDELIETALRLLANQPDLRRLLRKEAVQAIGRNKARFICRIATGGGVTLLLGAVAGPWDTGVGAGLGVAAAFGSAHALVENAVDAVGAEDLLRAALLGS